MAIAIQHYNTTKNSCMIILSKQMLEKKLTLTRVVHLYVTIQKPRLL